MMILLLLLFEAFTLERSLNRRVTQHGRRIIAL